MTVDKPKKVAVIGEAKSGKSTLLNELLALELLPTNVLQCTKNIIELSFAEDYSINLTLVNDSNITLQGIETVKYILNSVGAVNEKYRGLPINILEDFLYVNQGKFEELKILKLLKNIQNQNYLNYPLDEYELRVRRFLAANKKNWNKKVTMMQVNGPFSNMLSREITFVDTPGLGAEGDLGEITNQIIEDADIILLVKSITGAAVESANFKQLVDKIIDEYPAKQMILALTRCANMNVKDVNRVTSHTIKVFPNIKPNFIVPIDNRAQQYIRLFENMDFKHIKETIMLEAQNGNVETFIFAILMKSNSKEQFMENLRKLSNIAVLKDRIFKAIV